jgi:hypothetical protein
LDNLSAAKQVDTAVADVGYVEGVPVDDGGCHRAASFSCAGALVVLVERAVGSLDGSSQVGSQVGASYVVIPLHGDANGPVTGLAATLRPPYAVGNDEQLPLLGQVLGAWLEGERV